MVDLEDLIQDQALGLLAAAEKFDAERGWQFSTYASWWIRRAITLAMAKQARTIRLPLDLWRESTHLAQTATLLWQQLQREPTTQELAACLGCEPERVRFLLQLRQEPLSLEQAVSPDDEEHCLGDLLEAPDDSQQQEQHATVAGLLQQLTPQERAVVMQRYQLGRDAEHGIEDIPLPYAEVGRRLQMTDRLVKAVEARALVKMRFWAERGHRVVRSAPGDARAP